jgi:hypothetical protein
MLYINARLSERLTWVATDVAESAIELPALWPFATTTPVVDCAAIRAAIRFVLILSSPSHFAQPETMLRRHMD